MLFFALKLIIGLFTLFVALIPLTLSLAFFFGAPFVATPKKIIKEVIELSEMNGNDFVIDLGSGDGRVLIESAKICKKAVGFEINPFLVIWTKIIVLLNGRQTKIEVKFQNYNKSKLSDASIVFMYSIRKFVPALENNLKRELRPGTKIISYKFPLTLFKQITKTKSNIYLYIVK